MLSIQNNQQEEWLKVLGKGMVTLPKKWRDELRITTGDIIKAKKEGKKVIIEAIYTNLAPYRVYTDKEIDMFIQEDILPKALTKKAQKHITTFSTQ